MQTRFSIETDERVTIQDITDTVADRIPGIETGLCQIFVQHTSAGITINENESNLIDDMQSLLASLVPESDGYAHDRLDGNADAHLRSMLLGSSVSIPIREGELDLGTWQRILFVEGDGPRKRTVVVTVLED